MTFVSLVVINNPISDTFHQFLNNLSGFNEFLLFDGKSIQFNHTLCSLISGTLFAEFYDPKVQSALRMFCTVYPYAIGGLTLAILWRIRRFPFQARVSILTVMMVFFPFVSFDYTLIYLYIPFAWLLLDLSRMRKASLLDLLPVCLIGLISLPKQYLVGLFALGPGISFAVNGLALGALLVLFLVAPSAQEPSPAMSL